MNNSVTLSRGLETAALALIFAPEPFSTLVGIGILAAVQANKVKRLNSEPVPHYNNRFEDYYSYRLQMARNGRLGYQVEPVLEGQIPHKLPSTTKIYETKAWQHYRKDAYSYLNTDKPAKPHFSGLQQGLLNLEPMSKGQLPHQPAATTKIHDNKAWQDYRKNAYSYLKAEKPAEPQFSGLQQGLLKKANRSTRRKSY